MGLNLFQNSFNIGATNLVAAFIQAGIDHRGDKEPPVTTHQTAAGSSGNYIQRDYQ